MDREIKALCLRTVDYGETDKLLTLASLQMGKVTVKARGVRGAKAKLKSGCMPFVFGDYAVSDGKGSLILTGVNLEECFYNCWTDVKRNLAGTYVLELLEKISQPLMDSTFETVLALKALKEINYGGSSPFAACLDYAFRMLEHAGEDVSENDYFTQRIKDLIRALKSVELAEWDALEISEKEILEIMSYLSLIMSEKLGIKLNVCRQIQQIEGI